MDSLKTLLVTLLIFVCIRKSNGEVFTAIADMAPLLDTQSRLIGDVELYILLEEKRLDLLKKQLTLFKQDHEKAMEDILKYLGNPLNAFTLIKRLTADLEFFHRNYKLGIELSRNYSKGFPGVQYPDLEDLNGAVQGLIRLKDVYNLDLNDLSKGVINGIEYSYPMLASDCFVVGRELYNNYEYRQALPWFMEALNKFDDGAVDLMVLTETQLLDYIAFTTYMLGDVKTALKWTLNILDIDPNHERALNNLYYFKKDMKYMEAGYVNPTKQVDDVANSTNNSDFYQEKKKYEELCRGDVKVPIQVTSKLKCRYLTHDNPFLILAPFKVEELYKNPDLLLFHDVMSDSEIEQLQEMAKPKFQRATIRNALTGDLATATYRISKSGWLRDEESELVARISQRVKDMTTLDMASAEQLQVANYGIGGHYESHYDFTLNGDMLPDNPPHHPQDKRIATVLFYMSDVLSGGATAFTVLGLRVAPIKNSALFWMNLHPSGEGDLATRHAACPVLIGTKWVCTKWLHQEGQELIKPCNRQYQPEGINRHLPEPVPTIEP